MFDQLFYTQIHHATELIPIIPEYDEQCLL